MEQIHHAVLHPSERVVKLAWLLLNSELQFRVFPCSSTSWESQLKGCLCTNIKPDLSRQRKRHLLERSISKWKIYLFYKLHPRAISRLFLWIFCLFVCSFLFFSHLPLFIVQATSCFYSHAERCLKHPFTTSDCRRASVRHPRFQTCSPQCFSQRLFLALLSDRRDSPHFGRQSLLKPPLQILHVGRFGPWNERSSPSLGGAGGLLFTDFFAEDVEGIEDVVVVFADRHFIESTAQHVGQLKSMLRLHLFNMQEVSFVRYDDNRDSIPWMHLPNVVVQVTEQFIALIVCDGEDDHQGVRPANASVQLLVAIQAVFVDLWSEWSQIRWLRS